MVHGPGLPTPPGDLSNVTVNVAPVRTHTEGGSMAREAVTANAPEWQPGYRAASGAGVKKGLKTRGVPSCER